MSGRVGIFYSSNVQRSIYCEHLFILVFFHPGADVLKCFGPSLRTCPKYAPRGIGLIYYNTKCLRLLHAGCSEANFQFEATMYICASEDIFVYIILHSLVNIFSGLSPGNWARCREMFGKFSGSVASVNDSLGLSGRP